MSRKYKVLRTGISQQEGDHWVSPKIGSTIELSDSAAAHMLFEVPPFVEEVKGPEKGRLSSSTIGKKEAAR